MEKLISHEIDVLRNGMRVFKNYFLNPKSENNMQKAHSYFAKDERKKAKMNHKLNK